MYLGTPEMAVPPLRALHAAGHELVLVVSGADKRRGRRGSPTPSPVKAAAIELGLAVSEDPDDLLGSGAELGVVVAYGQMLRPHLLAALDMVNLHFSLLPRWRGAAPVERALLAGDTVTGVCLMAVEEGLDTGCVHECVQVPIDDDTTAVDLRARLVEEGTSMLVRALEDAPGDRPGGRLGECVPQPEEGVTYAHKLTSADLRLDWSGSGLVVDRVVRVGGAWTTFRGERFKVHAATFRPKDTQGPDAAGLHGEIEHRSQPGTVHADGDIVWVSVVDGSIELQSVQPAGKAPMAARDWVNGSHPSGERLGDHPGPGRSGS